MCQHIWIEDKQKEGDDRRKRAEHAASNCIDKPSSKQRQHHADHARRKEHAVAPIAEDKRSPIHKRIVYSRRSVKDRRVQVHGQQRGRSHQLHQRRHFGIQPIVMVGPNVIAIVEVMRLIPIGRVHMRNMDQLQSKQDQQ